MYVYIVVENGEAYQEAYTIYSKAKATVLSKHRETLEEQRQEFGDDMASNVDVKENKQTNETYLYIEKGINILIKRLPIKGTLTRKASSV